MNTDYEFYETFKKLLKLNGRDTELLNFRNNISKNSLYFGTYKICHFQVTKQDAFVCLPNSVQPLIEEYSVRHIISTAKTETFPIKISIKNIEIINSYAAFWISIYDDVYIRNNSDTYSFCSRWLECSSALKCTNPDKSDARLCKYKRNIEKGLVFEGEYAVFDENGSIDKNKVRRNLALMPHFAIVTIQGTL